MTETEEKKHKEPSDDEITDSFTEELVKFRDNLPYNKKRYLMITLFIVLVMLVVYLGYAYGGLKVCSDLDGILDTDFKCHPNYNPYNNTRNIDSVGQPFVIPINIEEFE